MMDFQFGWLLNLICYLPLAGALLMMAFINKENSTGIKTWATLVAGLDFVISIPLWFLYKPGGVEFQFATQFDWIPSVGVQYIFGVDGFSVLLILLTTLLGFIAVYSSFTAITERKKEYYISLLLLQTGMLGVFCSLDFILFYVFWEVMLVPMYFLIGVWGGPRRLYAAIKFFLYTLVGSVLMLVGILTLYFYNAGGLAAIGLQGLGNVPTFSIAHLYTIAPLIPSEVQFWVFLAFFVGFAIKVPMFPFHTWLPDAHVEAPTAASVILAAVLLKMGTYGFVRLSLPLLPEATVKAVGWIGVLAIIAIIYGALVAMAQKDMKKLVAYSSVSHMGFIMLGLFALNEPGLRGAILDAQPRGFHRSALPSRRHRVRAAPQPDDRGVRGPGQGDADFRHLLPRHHHVVDRAADLERLHRRVPDPHRRLQPLVGVGAVRGFRHRARCGVHAVAVPAGVLRRADQREEQGPRRPQPA
jgi:NADH-quinone oxidoreductase subunit M